MLHSVCFIVIILAKREWRCILYPESQVPAAFAGIYRKVSVIFPGRLLNYGDFL